MEQAHSAEFDAYLCHLLIEEWRLRVADPAPEPKIAVSKTVVEEPSVPVKAAVEDPPAKKDVISKEPAPAAPSTKPPSTPSTSGGRRRRRGQRNR